MDIRSFPPESFDCILLDPPCSALGLRPKLHIIQQTVADLLSYAQYQRLFVHQAVTLLKLGGYLTYSTCTINPAENERMVQYILKEFESIMELVPIHCPLGLPGLPGYGLTNEQRHFVRRFDPADTNMDTMGFFLAKFRKRII